MSGGNSLVAGPVNTTTPFSGLWLIEDGQGIAAGIENGDWLATGMSVLGGVLDTAAAIIDPIGQLLGMGMAWVLDHIAPISDWFKQLTGDAGQVAGFGQTWANVATRMHESGDLLSNRLGDLEGMAGATIDAYRAYAGDFAKHLHMLGDWSQAISTGLQAASTLVQVVHDLIRDILSQLVGTAVSGAITSALSSGTAVPLVIAQIGTRMAALLPKAMKAVKGLGESFKALYNLIRQLGPIIAKAGATFKKLLHSPRQTVGELSKLIKPGLPITIDNLKHNRPLWWDDGKSPIHYLLDADPVRTGTVWVGDERVTVPVWTRQPDSTAAELGAGTGEIFEVHGTSKAYPVYNGRNAESLALVQHPDVPYGRDFDSNLPLDKAGYDARYKDVQEDYFRFPGNDGADRGTIVKYVSADVFSVDHGIHFDRIGEPTGKYLAVVEDGVPASFESRALPLSSLEEKYYKYTLNPGADEILNNRGIQIEVSRVARGFGQPGGASQIRFFDSKGKPIVIWKLIKYGVLDG